jgi:hypothetical protein
MKDIVNKEIGRNFGNYDLILEWGCYVHGYGYVFGCRSMFGIANGNGTGIGTVIGLKDEYGFGYEVGYEYGDFNGNGESRTE